MLIICVNILIHVYAYTVLYRKIIAFYRLTLKIPQRHIRSSSRVLCVAGIQPRGTAREERGWIRMSRILVFMRKVCPVKVHMPCLGAGGRTTMTNTNTVVHSFMCKRLKFGSWADFFFFFFYGTIIGDLVDSTRGMHGTGSSKISGAGAPITSFLSHYVVTTSSIAQHGGEDSMYCCILFYKVCLIKHQELYLGLTQYCALSIKYTWT